MKKDAKSKTDSPVFKTMVDIGLDCRLELSDICFSYQDQAVLQNINLLVHGGEVMCLLGPSGCGKTTILRIAAGLLAPEKGRVRLGERFLNKTGHFTAPEDRRIGFLFQDYALFPHMTVAQNIAFGLRHLPKPERKKRVEEAMEMVYLTHKADSYPHTLSGGQQQRVALVRSIAPRPYVLLLDEPFSGLDARLRDKVRDNSLHLLQKTGITTLMVTHAPEEAMYMADRIAIMKEGQIVQTGSPDTLYYNPQNPYVASLMGEVNQFVVNVRAGRAITPFGSFKVDIEDGRADIIIRPEALSLSEEKPSGPETPGEESHPVAFVMASRLIGGASLVHMRCENPHGEEDIHLHARIQGRYLPEIDTRLYLSVDKDHLFIFQSDEDDLPRRKPVKISVTKPSGG